ncbi:FtsX-like permease family protein [Spirosoma sp. HMF4905]|uniref:FtsX-like permease family protein n=1 Tax=Spirosoma arboris TaxID=2682092 RepID=A0A7K1SBP5_9BACT|nr:ABC transporter permease [Spirosoma arboris]MVM31244.1 FtsX-like permease family protein [Spirosoma arboris]
MKPTPSRWITWLLKTFGHPDTLEEVQGDLLELYAYWVETVGIRKANWRYCLSALKLLRPLAKSKRLVEYPSPFFLSPNMIRNYVKIALRNLVKNKVYSFINIGGLAAGMAVAMLIGLWIYDELSFDKFNSNHSRIAKVMLQQTVDGTTSTSEAIPIPLGKALKNDYGSDFSQVVLTHGTGEQILAHDTNKFTKRGSYVEPEFLQLLPLKLLEGTQTALNDPTSIVLSASTAKALFGDTDPMNQIVKVNNQLAVKVAGVYEDFPANSEFRDVHYLSPWAQFVADQGWVKRAQDEDNWTLNSFLLLVQIAPNTDFDKISAKIAHVKATHAKDEAKFNPNVFLHPMSRWHLYSDWENGVPVRGRIQFVWLFGIIGAFVLLLACINFMNLSTARSEKRAKEVGIRKAVGSVRSQLISQFFSESFLVVALAFVLSLLLVQLALPWFNEIADKQMVILWGNPLFWAFSLSFSLLTGLIAGSYPALYLSGFQPIKVLKGTFRVGRFAAVPRKVLVVVQFTVSVTIIIGTIIVFRQIQYAKNRPIGYDRAGLLSIRMNTPDLVKHYDIIRHDLLQTGAVSNLAESSMPTTGVYSGDYRLDWKGRAPNQPVDFDVVACTHDFGKTVGWQIKEGRDFSRAFSTDSVGLIMNESAIKYMGLKHPVGEQIKWAGETYTIIGVVKDLVTNSPFEPVKQTVFKLNYQWTNFITIRLNPQVSASEALTKIAPVFRKYNPGGPFDYKFASDEHEEKFRAEERISQLATLFAILTIFISCLGLFGLASFVAEQRTKEIGVRKVLGASVFNLWQLLSKDFVVLVVISFLIASPAAYYVMNNWLQQYQYHSDIAWWIFALAGAGALLVTLLTVSFQSIRAALVNPVKSLRSE